MSSNPNSKNNSPHRFSTPSKAKRFSSPRGHHEPRSSESSMNSVINFTSPPGSRRRSLEEIRADPKFIEKRKEFSAAVGAAHTGRKRQIKNPKVKRKLFNLPEVNVLMSGPASKISVSDIATETAASMNRRIKQQEYANAKSEAKTKADAQAKAERDVPIPTNITSLFNEVDSRSENLSQNDQRILKRVHSMANSVMSYNNTNPSKIETLYNVQNNLQQLQSKLNSKVEVSAKQLKIISNLEKQLEREKEKHTRATELIKEFKIDDVPIPITKTILNTRKINELTKEMEKLKKGGDLNRSRLLGQIVSLAKKEKAAMGALSNMKNMTVTKNKNVTEMKRKLKEYATAVETLTEQLKKNQSGSPRTPKKQGIPSRTTPPSQTGKHRDAKKQGAEKRSEERRSRRKDALAVKRALEPEFNRIVKQKNTPPGITKTNIERLLQPFKQPVTVTVAPTISVSAKATGGSLKQTQIQYKSPVDKKKKKPLKFTSGPATARKQESAKFRNEIISKLRSPVAAKRREALYSLRTPTTGQRKKHVIELIDRVLRRMKVRADVEKKLIKFYESLSERHIKQLFGGRTKEGVKTILKKQVDYFSKKR